MLSVTEIFCKLLLNLQKRVSGRYTERDLPSQRVCSSTIWIDHQIGTQSGYINLHSHQQFELPNSVWVPNQQFESSFTFPCILLIFADEYKSQHLTVFLTMLLSKKWFWLSQHNHVSHINAACSFRHLTYTCNNVCQVKTE